MERNVSVVAVQPIGGDVLTAFSTQKGTRELHEKVLESGFKEAEKALKGLHSPDIVCFPELFNVFLLGPEEASRATQSFDADTTIRRSIEMAARYNVYIVLPILEALEGGFYANTTLIIDRRGELVGKYQKTHTTENERKKLNVKAGNEYPIFELDFGTVGVMTCWDAYFPEVARILSLKGAELLFHPRWMSGPSEIFNEIQIRARAIDNSVYVVSSSYGIGSDKAWRPGMFFGRSSIIGPDGHYIADASHYEGTAVATIDLNRQMIMDVLDTGGAEYNLKELILQDRRPETYTSLIEKI